MLVGDMRWSSALSIEPARRFIAPPTRANQARAEVTSGLSTIRAHEIGSGALRWRGLSAVVVMRGPYEPPASPR